MRIFLIVFIGFQLGQWCSSEHARDVGHNAGIWTREVLGIGGQP